MNCKYLKIRTRTIYNKERKVQQKYCYCTLLRKEVSFSCYQECDNKEYKRVQSLCKRTVKKEKMHSKIRNTVQIKGHKHKLTKATEISMKVKKIVWERDNHCC